MASDDQIRPFRIEIPETEIADLRDRVNRARIPAQSATIGWERGMPVDYLKTLADYWVTDFDWRAQEAKLNNYPQFTTEIDGQTIHFIHARSAEPDATPLMLLHGYPSSIVDFVDLIEPLTNPRAFGGDPTAAFHVVIPSLPGFPFSQPVEPGVGMKQAAEAFTKLMARLGYERYGAHGYDVGGGVAGELAKFAPDAVIGIHVSTDVPGLAYLGFVQPASDDASDEERAYVDALRAEAETGTGYLRITSTRPQTVAYAVNDSPIFQLAWIVEKFKEWTHASKELPEDAIDRDILLTNVSLYWFTQAGASAANFIYESMNAAQEWSEGPGIPTAFSVFGGDPFGILRGALDPAATNPNWVEHDEGRHFPSLEEPELVMADLRTFFGGLRA
jgi:pimeloyl-ACP methyl ester carboxylesterase